jgi:hypothetical protein
VDTDVSEAYAASVFRVDVLKKKAAYSLETPVSAYSTTRCHNLDHNLKNGLP